MPRPECCVSSQEHGCGSFDAWFDSKVRAVQGDVQEELLGLSGTDLARLRKEVNLVFHSAATVDFNAPLSTAIAMNVEGPLNCLEVSKGMAQLEAHIHVSTCYVNSDHSSGSNIEVRIISPLLFSSLLYHT